MHIVYTLLIHVERSQFLSVGSRPHNFENNCPHYLLLGPMNSKNFFVLGSLIRTSFWLLHALFCLRFDLHLKGVCALKTVFLELYFLQAPHNKYCTNLDVKGWFIIMQISFAQLHVVVSVSLFSFAVVFYLPHKNIQGFFMCLPMQMVKWMKWRQGMAWSSLSWQWAPP